LLVFDEISIGWRLEHGGAHLRYGVEPDMAFFSKALGNGHPIAAVIGTQQAMAGAHASFISSTQWTESVGPTAALATLVITTCGDCHAGGAAEGGLDLDAVGFDIGAAAVRDRFVLMHDRVAKGQMPPDPADLPEAERGELLATLSAALAAADTAAIEAEGRVPLRRLNRQEYQQTLRDLLGLPLLEVADRLPEDRVRDGFNKSAEGLDFSRIQLAATLDAAEAALAAAIAPGETPRPPDHYAALATKLFSEGQTFGNREAMFFAKDGAALALNGGQLSALRRTFVQDPAIECCIFRSAYWPYYGYPHGFVARRPGVYRVRFRARAVVQHKGYTITPAEQPVPMTFRARRPSGPDVSGDVRAVGGVFDIPPEPADFETLVVLDAGQTIEYSLLGLPVPLARNVNGGPPTYRYPPFPPSGQPGVAIQALEIVGPLSPDPWPPASHSVLFGELPFRGTKPGSPLPVEVMSADPATDARRLLAAFAERAVVAPLVADELTPFIAVADAALADVRQGPTRGVPEHLRDRHRPGVDTYGPYSYPHDSPGRWVDQRYLPDGLREGVFFRPGEQGWEADRMERLERLRERARGDE